MPKQALILLSLAGLCTASQADNCEAIASQIEARMRSGGLAAPRLVSMEVGSRPGGRVVGSCANGSRQIVLMGHSGSAGASPADPHATPRLRPVPADNIVTECKDGRVVRGPDCSRPAPRAVSVAASAPLAVAASPSPSASALPAAAASAP